MKFNVMSALSKSAKARNKYPTPVLQRQAKHSGQFGINQLESMIGNQAMTRLIQAKLTVGAANDKYEQEADHVADQVMRMPQTHLRRQLGEMQEDEEELAQDIIQTKSLDPVITPLVQRQTDFEEDEEEEEYTQTKSAPVSSGVQKQIHSLKGAGHPLATSERDFFEPRFGRDFGGVRIHTDRAAQQSARAINARAYTLGADVVFGAGNYTPQTNAGRRLLAHELTHVVQQKNKPEKGRDIQTKPMAGVGFESVVLNDIPFDHDPRRELFFEADVLERLGGKLADIRIPEPWGPHLMWTSNFRRDVYRRLIDMTPPPKSVFLAVDFLKGATLEKSSFLFAVVRTSLLPPPKAGVEPVYEPVSEVPALPEPLTEKAAEERRTEYRRLPTGISQVEITIIPSRPVPLGPYLLAWVKGTAFVRVSLPESNEKVLVSLKGVEFQKKLSDSLMLHGGPGKLAASIHGSFLGEAVSIKANLGEELHAPISIEARWHAIEQPLFIIEGVEITGELILSAKISLGPSPGLLLSLGKAAPLAGSFVLVLSMPFILADAKKEGETWGKNVSFRNGYAWRVAAEAAGETPGEWLKYVEGHYFRLGGANESFRNGWEFVAARISVLKSKGELEIFCNAIKKQNGTNQLDYLADSVFCEIGGIEKEAYPPSNLWQLVER